MAVTSQQIAELAGVSRGTVDRALHNRGRVNPEVAARIHKIAAELGYKPNIIGQALVRTKRDFMLGVILQSAETPTMQISAAGVRQTAAALRGSGVELDLREISGLDVGKVLEEIDGLVGRGMRGLAIAPSNAPELTERINELAEKGIPVVTLNSDLPASRRLCFIGMDNYRAGQTAAYAFSRWRDILTIRRITAVSTVSLTRCVRWGLPSWKYCPFSRALTGMITLTKSHSMSCGNRPVFLVFMLRRTDSRAFALRLPSWV